MTYQPQYLGELELSEETLAHYGVKGMKWGKRKGRKRTKSAARSRLNKIQNQLDPLTKAFKNAKTYEERSALATAMANIGTRGKGQFVNTGKGLYSKVDGSSMSRDEFAKVLDRLDTSGLSRKRSRKKK